MQLIILIEHATHAYVIERATARYARIDQLPLKSAAATLAAIARLRAHTGQ